jgi:nitrite reductase (NO-forming)
VFPPLADSDWIAGHSTEELIAVVLNGLSGPVKVNGKDYNSVMPPMSQLTDDEVANILTYVRQDMNDGAAAISKEAVAKVRAGTTRGDGAAH